VTDVEEIESSIELPAMRCPKCEGLLPNKLGEISCELCSSKVNVDDPATRARWKTEKVTCIGCGKVLIAGVDSRPAKLQCGSCEEKFVLKMKTPKTEINCPSCSRTLRINKRPGSREINCPACESNFRITF